MGLWIMQVEQELKYWKRGGITCNCYTENTMDCQRSSVSITKQSENNLSITNYNFLRN